MGNYVAELTQPCCAGESADKESEADFQPEPGSFAVKLDKSNGLKLGLDVYSTDPTCLPIKSITGGLAEEWNRSNPSKRMKPGDKIVKVNGVTGPLEMMDLCKRKNILQLVIAPGAGSGHENGEEIAQAPRIAADQDNINPAHLIEMTDMGIPEHEARDALRVSGGDLRRAVEYCRPSEQESTLKPAPAPPPSALAPAAKGGGGGDDKVQQLVTMGFASRDAQEALIRNNNDMERAMAFLVDAKPDGPLASGTSSSGATAIAQLVAMGFSAAQAREALQTSNGDVAQAVTILSAGDGPGRVGREREEIRALTEMGFTKDQAKKALDETDWNLDRAVNLLTSQ